MKKKVFIGILSCVSFIALLLFSSSIFAKPGDVITNPGDRVICNCTRIGGCAASGSRGMCAQSQPGGNVECWRYDRNCAPS